VQLVPVVRREATQLGRAHDQVGGNQQQAALNARSDHQPHPNDQPEEARSVAKEERIAADTLMLTQNVSRSLAAVAAATKPPVCEQEEDEKHVMLRRAGWSRRVAATHAWFLLRVQAHVCLRAGP